MPARPRRSTLLRWCGLLLLAPWLLNSCGSERRPDPTPALAPEEAAQLHERLQRAWRDQKQDAGGELSMLEPSDELVEASRRVAAAAPSEIRHHEFLVELLWASRAYQEVIEASDATLAHHPGHPPSLLMKGEALRLLGRLDEAQQVLEEGYQAALRSADLESAYELQAALGGVHLALQERSTAVELFERSVRGMEDASERGDDIILDSCPYLALAELYREDGRQDEALSLLHRGLELAPSNPQVVVMTYHQALRVGALDEAAEMLVEHRTLLPRRSSPPSVPWREGERPPPLEASLEDLDGQALSLAALLAWEQGAGAWSRELLAARLGGKAQPRDLVLRTVHLIEDAEIDEATVLAEGTLLGFPEDVGARVAMGHVRIARGDPEAAAALLAPHARSAGASQEPYQRFLDRLARIGLAWCHSAEGRHQRALVWFDLQLEVTPDDSAALLGSADALLALGRAEEARARAARAHELAPSAASAVGLGMVAARLGELGEAEGAYIDAMGEREGFACPYEGLGLLYLRQGRADEAVPMLEAAIELAADPERERALRAVLDRVQAEAGAPPQDHHPGASP